MPRSGNPSARTSSAWTSVGGAAARAVDVVGPAARGARASGCALPRAAALEAPSAWTRRKSAAPARVRDPRAGDVPHARAGGAASASSRRGRPRRAGGARSRSETSSVRSGSADPGDDAVRAAAVLDLPGRRARADRLGREIRARVVSRVDHDDRVARSPSRARHARGAAARSRSARFIAAGRASASRRRSRGHRARTARPRRPSALSPRSSRGRRRARRPCRGPPSDAERRADQPDPHRVRPPAPLTPRSGRPGTPRRSRGSRSCRGRVRGSRCSPRPRSGGAAARRTARPRRPCARRAAARARRRRRTRSRSCSTGSRSRGSSSA